MDLVDVDLGLDDGIRDGRATSGHASGGAGGRNLESVVAVATVATVAAVVDRGYRALLDALPEAVECGFEGLDLSGGVQSTAMGAKLDEVRHLLGVAFKQKWQDGRGSASVANKSALSAAEGGTDVIETGAPVGVASATGAKDSACSSDTAGESKQGKSKSETQAQACDTVQCQVWWDAALLSNGDAAAIKVLTKATTKARVVV
jgi:hypothetical protein